MKIVNILSRHNIQLYGFFLYLIIVTLQKKCLSEYPCFLQLRTYILCTSLDLGQPVHSIINLLDMCVRILKFKYIALSDYECIA